MLQALAALAMTAVTAAPSTEPPHKTLTVQLVHRCGRSTHCLSSRIIALMKKETERIWSHLDVRIAWFDSIAGVSAAPPAGLIVMLEEATSPEWAEHISVLAALTQPGSACGWGLVHLWVRHIEQHAELVRRGDHAFATLPPALADTFLGRALGRTLAHEIGHYLLGTGDHSAHGLMRAQFTPQDLLEDATRPLYGLNARERAGLMSCRASQVAEPTDNDR